MDWFIGRVECRRNFIICKVQLSYKPFNFATTKQITMELPKFILGDNSDYPEAIYIIHTEFPRFIINLENDQVDWLEEFDEQDQKELKGETENCIRMATEFYDREIEKYED